MGDGLEGGRVFLGRETRVVFCRSRDLAEGAKGCLVEVVVEALPEDFAIVAETLGRETVLVVVVGLGLDLVKDEGKGIGPCFTAIFLPTGTASASMAAMICAYFASAAERFSRVALQISRGHSGEWKHSMGMDSMSRRQAASALRMFRSCLSSSSLSCRWLC